MACVLNWLILERHINLWDENSDEFLAHPYTFQLVGLVFGYISVYRLTISYNRYWEGVTMVKNMHSKWADACGQVISFDRSRSCECDLTTDPFCCHVVRLFSQMSAMATMRLHIIEPGESMLFDKLQATNAETAQLKPLQEQESHSTTRLGGSFSRKRIVPESPKLVSSKNVLQAAQDQQAKEALGEVAQVGMRHGESRRKATKTDKVNELAAGISPAERRLLAAVPCPVFATAQRIQRAIITRLHAQGMRAPPPIVSRIFQEISNGLLAYNNATKMKEIPVPFAYVQLNAIFLNLFAIVLAPIAIASFTPTLWLSLVTTAVTTISFFAIFIVANEMEDPFGNEATDMPMIEYHEEFCASLCAIMTNAWLPEDQWLVPEGKWVRPRTVGLAANAFCDAVGRKNIRVARAVNPVPQSSVLNKAKATGSKGPPRTVVGRALNAMAGKMPRPSAFPRVVQHGEGPPSEDFMEEERMAVVIQRATRQHRGRMKQKAKMAAMLPPASTPASPPSPTTPASSLSKAALPPITS
eukprot:CAMPEP_0115851404 /NCGR_PEP_ID=MMETSP0287-20121206/12466_1 /TAXON_ID=412157 /ORGANISM="Chrysochromulina rotalis, Strain UIO044" /LENGTH=526 /DNA_ID=CAMNT_0003305439 /DNA_START=109 /DNA_END=1689 /DNA_ORIENTATION=-